MGVAAALLAGCTGGPGSSGVGPAEPLSRSGLPAKTTPSSAPPQWVVTLGDSYISGEGARWAGNTSTALGRVDAQGADAYLDGRHQQERQPGCRRAEESIAQLDYANVRGRNLACSGATLRSHGSGAAFKPGLDSYSDSFGHFGQLVALRRFAASHDVTALVISIGGNDFGFAPVLAQCVTGFLLTAESEPQHCSDDPGVIANFSARRVHAVSGEIAAALGRVSAAMAQAGYRSEDFRLLVLNYPSPVPPGPQLRYPETLRSRYTIGGCPLFSADATWAATALGAINAAVRSGVRRSRLANVGLLDLSRTFVGHRLCERGVGQLEEVGLSSWRDPAAADSLEWVTKLAVTWLPWQVQGSLHPGYFGMLAERSCVRQALRAASRRVSRCLSGGSGTHAGEPVMVLR